MGMFFLGILFGFFLEWLFVTFYLNPRKAESEDIQVKGAESMVVAGNEPVISAECESEETGSLVTDDLTSIPGIGPRKRDALATVGIATFSDLVAADRNEVEARLKSSEVRIQLAGFENWQEKAKAFL